MMMIMLSSSGCQGLKLFFDGCLIFSQAVFLIIFPVGLYLIINFWVSASVKVAYQFPFGTNKNGKVTVITASVVQWSEFLTTEPEVQARFWALPDFFRK
jgi:hypothetical protein